MKQLDPAFRSAIDAVSAACELSRAVQQDLDRVRLITKDDLSPVTVADFAAQAVIAMALRETLGDVLIVGEEKADRLRDPEHAAVREEVVEAVRAQRGPVGADDVLAAIDACRHDASAETYWTLDPIDGTKGFLRGQQYAIALARLEQGQVTIGVMGCPNLPIDAARPLDEPDPHGAIYAAVAGSGCWRWPADDPSGEPSPVTARPFEARAAAIRICESVEAAHSRRSDTERILDHLGLEVAYARLDSQCKYSLVARGDADAYLRMPTKKDYSERIWDHAAGMLIATEAGAVVTDIAGAALDFTRGLKLEANRGVACAAQGLHERIIEAIARLGIAAAV